MPTSKRLQGAAPSLVSSDPGLFDSRAYVRLAQLALKILDYGKWPGAVHLDTNLRRALALNLTFNARSANLLTTNITDVNTVVSSSVLGQPIAAQTVRRVGLGSLFSIEAS
jgi:hypothetical protein